MDLTEFLKQRLDDEERLALDAASEGTPSRTGWQLWTNKVDVTPAGERLGPRGSVEASPARVLADVESKRRIVEEYVEAVRRYERLDQDDDNHKWEWLARSEALEGVLRLLALPHAGNPDYDEEWKP